MPWIKNARCEYVRASERYTNALILIVVVQISLAIKEVGAVEATKQACQPNIVSDARFLNQFAQVWINLAHVAFSLPQIER